MADYKLYYPNSLDYVKENNKPITFDDSRNASQYGMQYSKKNHTINPWITKDTLNPELKEKIERKSGEILFVKDAPDKNNKHFAISQSDNGKFNVLEIDKTKDQYKVQMKAGYPDKRQAHDDLHRMYKNLEREIDRGSGLQIGR